MCPQCGEPAVKCQCRNKASSFSGDGIVRVGRETKGRKGKGVSLITGVPLADQALAQLAKKLKAKCVSGGTVKNGIIEIQGDHRDLLVEELKKEGFTVKRSGG
ncbi:MAG: translation initiation factor Sui1 [Desulfovermiculus sp.]|nr:translation initiation factor Sui1 [Desulfovermiculus sp.]